MKTLIIQILSFFLCVINYQNANSILLRNFIRDAVDTKLSNTEIGDKYFCTSVLHRKDKYGEKARSYLEFALSNQRRILRTKQINLDSISFKSYNKLSEKEIPPKPFHMLNDTSNVYVGVYRKEPLVFVLLDGNKIASTLFIGQGDEHYFVDFCH